MYRILSMTALCAQLTLDPLLLPEARQSFRELISKDQIETAVQAIALQIDADLQGEEVILLVVLKGAMVFASDLSRCLQSPCRIECIRAKSYGMNGNRRSELTISGLEEIDLAGKNVLIVEDIFDSGVTLSTIMNEVQKMNPKKNRSVTLLIKNVKHLTDYRPDYSLFEIEDHFVIGYGLDYKEKWRHLPAIYISQ